MGVDCTAVAGYGIPFDKEFVKDELLEEIEESGDEVESFMYERNVPFIIEQSGSYYTGEVNAWVMLSDPLNNLEGELEVWNQSGIFKKEIKRDDIQWICEILWR